MTWLLTGLRGRGGVYHLTSADAVANLPPGSIVLFRYGHEIIGEAVVRKGKKLEARQVELYWARRGSMQRELLLLRRRFDFIVPHYL